MTRLKRIITATAVAVTVALAAWLNAPVAAPGEKSLTVEYVPVGKGAHQKPFTRTLTWKD